MSLVKLTAKKINRKTVASVPYLFNTNRISALVVDGSDSIFYYTKNVLNDREGTDEIKVDETKAAIDALWSSVEQPIILTTLKKKTPLGVSDYAATITIDSSKVGFAWADPNDASKSWIEVYSSAFKKITYQVGLSLDQLNGMNNFLLFKFEDSLNGAFVGGDRTGVITYSTGAIAISVPNATVVTALVASWTVNTGCTVKVSTTAQVSGITQNNFSSPVVFVVTSPTGLTKSYTVTVTVL